MSDKLIDEIVQKWTELERLRRKAWCKGPTEAEKLAWWQRKQSVEGIGPSDDDVSSWTTQEQERRAQWLKGPNEWEKKAYRRGLKLDFLDPRTSRFDASRLTERLRRRLALSTESKSVDQESDEWAENEKNRRKAWAEGPSEEEIHAYREYISRESLSFPPGSSPDLEQRLYRRIRKGSILANALLRQLPSIYTQLVRRAGEAYSEIRPRIKDGY